MNFANIPRVYISQISIISSPDLLLSPISPLSQISPIKFLKKSNNIIIPPNISPINYYSIFLIILSQLNNSSHELLPPPQQLSKKNFPSLSTKTRPLLLRPYTLGKEHRPKQTSDIQFNSMFIPLYITVEFYTVMGDI